MDVAEQESLERTFIANDASFMVGLFLATRSMPGRSNIPYLFSCIDFYSLIVHETYNYHLKRDPDYAAKLKHRYAEDIKRSRQRVKIFDDNKLGIEGIGKTLLDTITPAHQKNLSKTHRIKLPKWMWDDIGLYFIEGNPIAIASTHLASFNTGIDIVRMFDPSTHKEFGEELGRFLIEFAKTIDLVRLPALSIIAKDVRSESIYTTKRYGSPSKLINAGLSIIDMNLNFMGLCLPPSSRHLTLFKWKFLTTYHCVSSLKLFLASSHADDINGEVLEKLRLALDNDFARLLETEGASALRNTFTHYGLDSRLNTEYLTQERSTYYGLVESALPEYNFSRMSEELDEYIKKELLNLFDSW